MHRSGTSALTELLGLLGVDLPSGLVPAMSGVNPRGFFESAELNEVNDRLLAALGRSWSDLLAPPRSAEFTEEERAFRDGALTVLRRDFAESRLFALKDPRLCRLLPVWLDCLNDFGARPSAIIALRHPLEVATSLAARDGTDVAEGLLLWLSHLLPVERLTRGWPRSVVSYDALLDDWKAEARRIARDLEFAWPRDPSAVELHVETFLSPELCHHQAGVLAFPDNPAIARACCEAFEALHRLREAPDDPLALAMLDQVALQFDAALDLLRPVIERGQRECAIPQAQMRPAGE